MSLYRYTQQKDHLAFLANNTPVGEQLVADVTRLVGSQFAGSTIDPNFWTSTTANSATITQAGNEIALVSGTNSAASAKLHSVRKGRVIAGVSQQWRGGIQVNNIGIASNTRKWGVAWGATMPTITDGAYFQLDGTTFSVVTLKGGTPTVVSSGSFNGSVSSYTMTTSLATYEIYYTQTAVKFVINGVLIHTVSATTTPWSNQIDFHCYMENVNSGNTTSVDIQSRFSVIRRFGKEDSAPTYAHITTATTTILKYSMGKLHKVIVNNPTNNPITIYDNSAASGAIIAVIDPDTSNVPFELEYDVAFQNGLTIVTAGTPDLTILYE